MRHLGKLLAASPSQRDPFWAKSVVWLYEYSQGNYAGLIINRPSTKTCADLAQHHGVPWHTNEPLFVGGPVSPNALILQHTGDWRTPNTQHISDSDMCLSSHKSMLSRLSQGDEPASWRLILGYSAWSAPQLEAELKRTDWVVADFNTDLVWDRRRPEVIWHQCVEQAAQQTVDRLFEIL